MLFRSDPLDVDNDEDGYTENEGDCNDTDAFINPGATDVCGDGIDNDCSGSDETCSTDPLDIDDDEDGYTENEGDCNDTDSSINPWAYDIPDDGIDQDCSGTDASSGSGGDPEPTPGPGAFEDFNIETEGLSDSSKDLNHSFLDYSFKDRFSRFFADLKGTGIFNVVDNPVSDIPTIGSSVIDIDAGVYGQHSFDFAGWSSGLIILRSLFLICASWVAIKMLVLKK